MGVLHLNQKQLAARWSISEATLERWCSEGIGPKFLKLPVAGCSTASSTSRPTRSRRGRVKTRRTVVAALNNVPGLSREWKFLLDVESLLCSRIFDFKCRISA